MARKKAAKKPQGRTIKKSSLTKREDMYKQIGKPSVLRLARRGGVKRVGGNMHQEAQIAAIDFLEQYLYTAFLFTSVGGRKTITAADLVEAHKSITNGGNFYGV